MNREIEIRVFERSPGLTPTDYPVEREIYTLSKTIDIEHTTVFDLMDEAKMAINVEFERELTEDANTALEGLFDDEDRISDQAKAKYYHDKHGDAL